ncbi:hypothetical protein CBR_g22103 [Chara braunii]|uniref:Uncharacterized protein n=1 Tax=Chara braunii TaxID=69332 RepID=A0A388L205_CHABU|nr:hypothetical protein CBR_g22103 [Chara braunii]|eukprot:GBG76356.1 hypothetical protein CBR_g22103 [Chara braunii]
MDKRWGAASQMSYGGGARSTIARSPSRRSLAPGLLLLLAILFTSGHVLQRVEGGGGGGGGGGQSESPANHWLFSPSGVRDSFFTGDRSVDVRFLRGLQDNVHRRSMEDDALDLTVAQPLIEGNQSSVVVEHPLRKPFNISTKLSPLKCETEIRNIVHAPSSRVLYYILDEHCVTVPANKTTKWMLSYWKVDLQTAAVNGTATPELISNWWHSYAQSTAAVKFPIVVDPEDAYSPPTAHVYGMDLVPNDTSRLLLGATTEDQDRSKLIFMFTSNGSRSSAITNVPNVQSLAFNPAKTTQLWVSDSFPPFSSLLAADTDSNGGGNPPPPVKFDQMAGFVGVGGEPKISGANFGPQSFDPSGKCLYFVDRNLNQIWAIEPESGKVPTHVAGTGKAGDADGGIETAQFDGLRAVSYTHLDVYKRQALTRAGNVSIS